MRVCEVNSKKKKVENEGADDFQRLFSALSRRYFSPLLLIADYALSRLMLPKPRSPFLG